MDKDQVENEFYSKSALAQRRRVMGEQVLPKPEELEVVTGVRPDDLEDCRSQTVHMDPVFKAAQKGPKTAEAQLQALLEGVPIGPNDLLWFIDLYPHAGCRTMAVHNFSKQHRAEITYAAVAVGGAFKNIEFPKKRLQLELAADWLNGAQEFYKVDVSGSRVAVRPNINVQKPTEEQLQRIPGGKEAWAGLTGVSWQALIRAGGSLIIDPKWTTEFQSAPMAVSEAFQELLATHKRDYQDALTDLVNPGASLPLGDLGDSNEIKEDPRGPAANTEHGGLAPPCLVDFPSREALTQTVAIVHTCKSMLPTVEVLRDDRHTTYLLSSANIKIPPNTTLAGCGGGGWSPDDPGFDKALTWSLPDGDKTFVTLSPTGHEVPPEEEVQDKKKKKPTLKPQTMYNVIRDLERANQKDIKVASYGLIRPVDASSGEHGYEFIQDIPADKRLQFMLRGPETTGKKDNLNAEKIMLPGLTKKLFEGRVAFLCQSLLDLCKALLWQLLAGFLKLQWRIMYERVTGNIKPQKPYFATAVPIELKAGVPVRVAWVN